MGRLCALRTDAVQAGLAFGGLGRGVGSFLRVFDPGRPDRLVKQGLEPDRFSAVFLSKP